MAFNLNLTGLVHSLALKEFAKNVLAAAKQLADEGAAVAASSEPIAAPAIAIAQPLADAFFDQLIERVKHLEENQAAKEVAVSAVVLPPAA